MSAYLKRLNIGSLEEVGVDTTSSAYLKRVEIVEVVDSDGNTWEPAPGPDPWDKLEVTKAPSLFTSNKYFPGNNIKSRLATFSGGSGEIELTYQFQYQEAGSSVWVDTGFSSGNFNAEVNYTIPPAAAGGRVRQQSKATDTVTSETLIANTPTSPVIGLYPELKATGSISGTPRVGETLTATHSITGGLPPYEVTEYWTELATGALVSTSNTLYIRSGYVGKRFYYHVEVTDAEGREAEYLTPTSVIQA